MRIDAHQHYWKLDRGDYGWLTSEKTTLYRDFLPEHLQPHLASQSIDRTVLVQAASTVAETEFMLSLCEKEPSIAGVVGWLDMESDNFKTDFLRLRANKYFVGLRPMLHDLEDDHWILKPKVIESLQLLMEHDFPVDYLVYPRHLPALIQLMDILPNLKGTIDHIGKPQIKQGIIEPWKQQIAKLAHHKNIYCKLSGMVTEADLEHWNVQDFKPYIDHIVAIFGADRVMFGSDWPVCLLAATYEQVYEILNSCLPNDLSKDKRDAIFGGNAIEFYNLPDLNTFHGRL
ncbi:amidohydrolase family protein [Paenibacillus eucommiae]|uniref:L-fuconolactonase n=1 Tax=Paenibacillus eucommiae TaxID=1355755 RepID=A0ABS4IRK2_9BACL|nr:amidohydrolase family protein [Paenibacillus eucommiae]MBP1990170.1 L-fuconolactonase [Paenibacillus eucommiae]